MVDEPLPPTDRGAPPERPAGEDPATTLARARRRKRRAWLLGLGALGVAGAAWAVIAQWPQPTSHIRLEVDVTCPMQVHASVTERGGSDRKLPTFLVSPLPNAPGQTVVFPVDSSPGAYASLAVMVPDGLHVDDSRCRRTACRIYADGALVFEALTTAGRWLTCHTTTDRRSPTPALSRPFADTLTIPVLPR